MTPDRSVAFSRRAVLRTGAALGAAAPIATIPTLSAHAAPSAGSDTGYPSRGQSVRDAISFLQGVTDAYRSSDLRLVQSYQDGSGLGDIGFIYDNALTSIALLSAGDIDRAAAIGDALLYAQNHDQDFSDGRLRQAYHVNHLIAQDGHANFGWEFGLVGTAVGDMSWSGLALAQLAQKTKEKRFLDGTVAIGEWIYKWTHSTTGLKGYTFGETDGLQDHKSTEHNVDVYALFNLLAKLTGDAKWTSRAQWAWDFVERVWNAEDGFFWTGSDDGAAINKNPVQLPLDVQTWSWLAAKKRKYAACLDWAQTNLATTDTPLRINSALKGNQTVTGVGFASGTFRTDVDANIGGQTWNPKPDDSAVWFEGTGQLALALRKRGRAADEDGATKLLGALRWAQAKLGDKQTFNSKRIEGGIVAATSPLDTGFKFGYFPNLHVAATSWYVFAATRFNPYVF